MTDITIIISVCILCISLGTLLGISIATFVLQKKQ